MLGVRFTPHTMIPAAAAQSPPTAQMSRIAGFPLLLL
jgi:hypothetical protein